MKKVKFRKVSLTIWNDDLAMSVDENTIFYWFGESFWSNIFSHHSIVSGNQTQTFKVSFWTLICRIIMKFNIVTTILLAPAYPYLLNCLKMLSRTKTFLQFLSDFSFSFSFIHDGIKYGFFELLGNRSSKKIFILRINKVVWS